MITINVIDDKICGSYGDKAFTVEYSDELYERMKQLDHKAQGVTTVEEYNEVMEEFAPLCIVDYTATIETQPTTTPTSSPTPT